VGNLRLASDRGSLKNSFNYAYNKIACSKV